VTARLTILHRDDEMVIVSKPSGLLVHRSPEARDRSFLLQRVAAQVGERLYPVHRIDRAASGIVLFGTSSASAGRLHRLLAARETRKEYLVLVRGQVTESFGYLRPLTDERGRKRPARTTFEPIARFDGCSLLLVRLHTGRRHQIRRHLNHLGHHAIGDTTHGKGQVNRVFREHGLHRLFLHHTRLSMRHERLGGEFVIEDPLPGELQWVIDRLPPVRGSSGRCAPTGNRDPTDRC